MPLIEDAVFDRAVRNIAATGDTDVFPWPFENHVFHDQHAEVRGLLGAIASGFDDRLVAEPPITNAALAQVGYNGFRWATQIDPLWNAYFLSVVLSLVEDIEAARVPVGDKVIFSHRYDPNGGDHLFSRDGWTQFRDESLQLAKDHAYVVSVDIADFYGRVYHHRIENELKYVDAGGERARQIVELLSAFSGNVSYGLPVGGPASRILSELVLNALDRLLLTQLRDAKFTRYADDYRFFVNDLESAYRAIGFMSEKLYRNEGLSLQRSKTRIMTSAEYVEALGGTDPRPGSAEKFLSLHLYYDPYSPTAEDDYERLRDQLSEFDVLGMLRTELFKGRIDAGLTRRLMSAIKLMDRVPKEQAIKSLLENFTTLAPVVPNVMRVVRENVGELGDEARAEVFLRIREMIETGHHLAQVDVNLAYMVRVLAMDESHETTALLIQLYDRQHGYSSGPAANIQRDILVALARRGATWWLHDIKQHFGTMHSWVRRSFIVSSYVLGDEGKHWRNNNKQTFSDFEKLLVLWASARVNQAGWRVPI